MARSFSPLSSAAKKEPGDLERAKSSTDATQQQQQRACTAVMEERQNPLPPSSNQADSIDLAVVGPSTVPTTELDITVDEEDPVVRSQPAPHL